MGSRSGPEPGGLTQPWAAAPVGQWGRATPRGRPRVEQTRASFR